MSRLPLHLRHILHDTEHVTGSIGAVTPLPEVVDGGCPGPATIANPQTDSLLPFPFSVPKADCWDQAPGHSTRCGLLCKTGTW